MFQLSLFGYVFIGVLVVLPILYFVGMALGFAVSVGFGLVVEGGARAYGWLRNRLGLVAVLALAVFGAGCQTGSEPATCSPCGDGAIVCTATVTDCIADNGGTCTTKIGATGAATIALNGDGSYIETSDNGTTTGTWTQNGNAIVLDPVGALLSVYESGAACPYAAVSQ